MKITIIGAGMAGLTAGISFKKNGYDIEIIESSDSIQEVGAGIQISPNGNKILQYLGVQLEGQFEPEAVIMRKGKTGREIFSIPMREYANERWHAPFYNILRADLQRALLSRAEELNIPITLGKKLTKDEITSLHINAKNQNNLLIGADGVHSETRKILYPNIQPKFSGSVAYRALVPMENLSSPPGPYATIWTGKRKHAVTTRVDLGNIINFVGICEEKSWREEGWNHEISANRVRNIFKKWHISIFELLKNVDSLKRWALLYHPPIPNLVVDNTVLIGDAAHPMLPSFAQGAVQAFEDAYILAECVNEGQLGAFNDIRAQRISRVQRASRSNMRLYHRGPITRFAYFNGAWVLNRIAPDILCRKLDWLYGYDPINALKYK